MIQTKDIYFSFGQKRRVSIAGVLATHDVDLVPLSCDRVAIMSQESIINQGPPGSIFSQAEVIRKAGLRLPRIGHLVEVLKKEDGFHFEISPFTIGEARRELINMVKSSAGTPPVGPDSSGAGKRLVW